MQLRAPYDTYRYTCHISLRLGPVLDHHISEVAATLVRPMLPKHCDRKAFRAPVARSPFSVYRLRLEVPRRLKTQAQITMAVYVIGGTPVSTIFEPFGRSHALLSMRSM